MEAFGSTLREWRERRSMSLDTLARASGVSKNYLQGLETGRKRHPSMGIVQAIARALGVPVATFAAGEPLPVASLADTLRELSDRCRALETTQVPLRGTVPGEVREHTGEYVEVPLARLEGSGDVYALEVTEPLTEEGLDSGDYVVVTASTVVTEGGGVYIVKIGGANVMRRAWRVGSQVHVRPGVDGESVFASDAVSVLGRVILGGRWRQF